MIRRSLQREALEELRDRARKEDPNYWAPKYGMGDLVILTMDVPRSLFEKWYAVSLPKSELRSELAAYCKSSMVALNNRNADVLEMTNKMMNLTSAMKYVLIPLLSVPQGNLLASDTKTLSVMNIYLAATPDIEDKQYFYTVKEISGAYVGFVPESYLKPIEQ